MDWSEDFEVRPFERLGAEIVGLDEHAATDATKAALQAVWREHKILLFRGRDTSPATLVRLTALFGELDYQQFEGGKAEVTPEMIVLGEGETKGPANIVDGQVVGGFIFFHMDEAYTPSLGRGTMLQCRIAPDEGGRTQWVDLEAAFAALPDALKAQCRQRASVNELTFDLPARLWGWNGIDARPQNPDFRYAFEGARADFPHVAQPMVIRHADRGTESLLISPAHYVRMHGMDREEGDAFFDTVAAAAIRPDFSYVHDWRQGDIILWDNYRTMHAALGYPYDQIRVMQRTVVKGSMPTGQYVQDMQTV